MAATVTTGTLLATASSAIRVLAAMKKSSLPAISSMRLLSFGPGLEKSAVLGLGNPVGSERDLVQRLGACRHDRRKNRHQGNC